MSKFTTTGDHEFEEKVEELARKRGIKKTEILERALSLYFLVEENLDIGNPENPSIVEIKFPTKNNNESLQVDFA
jgi:hypothetical protein